MKNESNNLPSTLWERLFNGLVKENPTFVLLLGMCPTLAVTTSAINGLGMGLSTLVVLALSNMLISALRKVIPNKVRIPAFIVIIASFVTIVELLLKAYIPVLYNNLGLYIPLIVVNCIILGRAEAYAYSNPVLPSLFDGIGMGLGFSVALTIIGGVRELVGAGEIFGYHVMPASYIPVSIFIMAPGAFFVLAILTAIQNAIKIAGEKKGKDMSKIQSGCGGNCLDCEKDCKKPEITNSTKKTDTKSAEKTEKKKDKKKAIDKADKNVDDEVKKQPELVNTNEVKNEASSEVKVETSPEVKVETSPEIKVETSPEVKVETVPEIKVEEASDVNIETSSETIIEASSENKVELPADIKIESGDVKVEENIIQPLGDISPEIKEEIAAEDKEKVSLETKEVIQSDLNEDIQPKAEEITPEIKVENAEPDKTDFAELENIIKSIESTDSEDEEIILLTSEDDETFELIDIEDYKNALNSTKKKGTKGLKKPLRKKGGLIKAKEMLSKAEETVNGEEDK